MSGTTIEFELTRRPAGALNAPQQLDKAELLARRAGLTRAATMIGEDRERRYPIRDWEYGACAWCETEGHRRKATMLDIGSGTPECDRCANEPRTPTPQAVSPVRQLEKETGRDDG